MQKNPSNVAETLIGANHKWAQGKIDEKPNFFKDLAGNLQTPKVLWIGCSDSRVPAGVVTASMPGDIFTHTNIANQFHADDDNANSILSYAVKEIGVEHVVLVGHSGCGGVKAAIEVVRGEPLTHKTPLARWLQPLVDLVGGIKLAGSSKYDDVDTVVKANIEAQFNNICGSEPILTAWKDKKNVTVHGWVYNLNDGQITKLYIKTPDVKA